MAAQVLSYRRLSPLKESQDDITLPSTSHIGSPTAFSTALKPDHVLKNKSQEEKDSSYLTENPLPSFKKELKPSLHDTNSTQDTPLHFRPHSFSSSTPFSLSERNDFSLRYYSASQVGGDTSLTGRGVSQEGKASCHYIIDEVEPTLMKEAADFSLQKTITEFSKVDHSLLPAAVEKEKQDEDSEAILLPYLVPSTPIDMTTTVMSSVTSEDRYSSTSSSSSNNEEGESNKEINIKSKQDNSLQESDKEEMTLKRKTNNDNNKIITKVHNPFDSSASVQSYESDFETQGEESFLKDLQKEEVFAKTTPTSSLMSTFTLPSGSMEGEESMMSYFQGKSFPLGDLQEKPSLERPKFSLDQLIISPPGIPMSQTPPTIQHVTPLTPPTINNQSSRVLNSCLKTTPTTTSTIATTPNLTITKHISFKTTPTSLAPPTSNETTPTTPLVYSRYLIPNNDDSTLLLSTVNFTPVVTGHAPSLITSNTPYNDGLSQLCELTQVNDVTLLGGRVNKSVTMTTNTPISNDNSINDDTKTTPTSNETTPTGNETIPTSITDRSLQLAHIRSTLDATRINAQSFLNSLKNKTTPTTDHTHTTNESDNHLISSSEPVLQYTVQEPVLQYTVQELVSKSPKSKSSSPEPVSKSSSPEPVCTSSSPEPVCTPRSELSSPEPILLKSPVLKPVSITPDPVLNSNIKSPIIPTVSSSSLPIVSDPVSLPIVSDPVSLPIVSDPVSLPIVSDPVSVKLNDSLSEDDETCNNNIPLVRSIQPVITTDTTSLLVSHDIIPSSTTSLQSVTLTSSAQSSLVPVTMVTSSSLVPVTEHIVSTPCLSSHSSNVSSLSFLSTAVSSSQQLVTPSTSYAIPSTANIMDMTPNNDHTHFNNEHTQTSFYTLPSITPYREPHPPTTLTESHPLTPPTSILKPHPSTPPITKLIEVPLEISFTDICCVGGVVQECIEVKNISLRWIQGHIMLTDLYCNDTLVECDRIFSFLSKCFIAPGKSESIKLTFSPETPGSYKGHLSFSSSFDGNLLATIIINAKAERPNVQLLTPSSNTSSNSDQLVLDYGTVIGGQSIVLPLHVVNHGRSLVPLRLSLATNTLYWYCYSLSLINNNEYYNEEQSLTSSSTLNITLPSKQNTEVESPLVTVMVKFNPNSKSINFNGPVEECPSRIDVSIDDPLNSSGEILCSVPVNAKVGVAKLCIPRSMQELVFTCGTGSAHSTSLPLKNGGNVMMNVKLFIKGDYSTYYTVHPNELNLSPEQKQHIQIIFKPTSHLLSTNNDNNSCQLMLCTNNDGPTYQIKLIHNITTAVTTHHNMIEREIMTTREKENNPSLLVHHTDPSSSRLPHFYPQSSDHLNIPTNSLSSPLITNSSIIDIRTLQFNDTQIKYYTESQFVINNPYQVTMTWKIIDLTPPFVKENPDDKDAIFRANYSVFWVHQYSGVIPPCHKVTVRVTFQPQDIGIYSQVKDIEVTTEDGQTLKTKISFGGKGVAPPQINYFSNEVISTSTPHFINNHQLAPPIHHMAPPINVVAPPTHTTTLQWRKVYLDTDTLSFPNTELGKQNLIKIKVLNKDTCTHQFHVISPHSPFSVLHYQFELTPRHCARLPVYYTPNEVGHHQSVLAIKTNSGHQMFALLQGTCTTTPPLQSSS